MMKKILLIEDNLEVRENTAEMLELANYEVSTAENGKIGVDLALQNFPDLIICDIMMPVMDGYEVLYLLSKRPETASIPFVFLTAKAEKSDIRKGMNLGADDYLTKPFEEMDLMNAVETRLNKSEIFKKEFGNDAAGLNAFMKEARGFEELNALSELKEGRLLKKKEYIFHEGEYPNFLYFINKGIVKTSKMNEDGKEYITGVHNAGGFLGYMDILQDSNYSESSSVMEASEIVRIPREDFLQLLNKNRDVTSKFIQMLSGDLIEKETELLRLAYDSVRRRTAEILLQLKVKFRKEGETKTYMEVGREDLASMVGTAKETLIRTLSDFREEGIISIEGRKIVIEDTSGLESIRY